VAISTHTSPKRNFFTDSSRYKQSIIIIVIIIVVVIILILIMCTDYVERTAPSPRRYLLLRAICCDAIHFDAIVHELTQ
jgi:hypothetical protein